jgi:hypothetical protein
VYNWDLVQTLPVVQMTNREEIREYHKEKETADCAAY